MGWSSRPDYLMHGWWCQCVCATDWGRYTQQLVVGLSIDILYYVTLHSIEYLWFEGWWLTSTVNGWPCVAKLLLLLYPKHEHCGEATHNCGVPLCWHGNVVVGCIYKLEELLYTFVLYSVTSVSFHGIPWKSTEHHLQYKVTFWRFDTVLISVASYPQQEQAVQTTHSVVQALLTTQLESGNWRKRTTP